MEYHAHVYWRTPEERETALSLQFQLEEWGCRIGRVWDQPIGPHPLPMYQVLYNSSNANLVEDFLSKYRGNNSVLLHESILDDLRDHTEGTRWLGTPLELKLDFFKE